MTVYVENWQMDCCGEPFSAGSHVSWTLIQGHSTWIQTILGSDVGITVDAKEDHHGKASCRNPSDAEHREGHLRGLLPVRTICRESGSVRTSSRVRRTQPGGTGAHRFGHHHYGGQGKFLGYIAQIITS
jgi:hypothetical protein